MWEAGIGMRKVEVCSYNELWPHLFKEEANHLQQIYRDELVDIYHIGSSSVPGLSAKPIIDIMPVVRDITKVDKYNEAMQEIGYIAKGENGIAGRRYFQKGGDQRTHHIHIYQQGSHEIIRHLAFRDYLKVHPEVSRQYGALKEGLASQFPYDIDSYINGKDRFVKELEVRALEWYEISNQLKRG